jgi:plasmid stability protein
MSSQEIVQSSEQLVIKLDHDLIEKLRQSASSHDRSIDEEVREILRDSVTSEGGTPVGLGTQLAAIFHGVGIDEEISELRGYPVEPIEFDP